MHLRSMEGNLLMLGTSGDTESDNTLYLCNKHWLFFAGTPRASFILLVLVWLRVAFIVQVKAKQGLCHLKLSKFTSKVLLDFIFLFSLILPLSAIKLTFFLHCGSKNCNLGLNQFIVVRDTV